MKLQIEPTKSTPLIELDASSNVQRFEGVSMPIDASGFYKPIEDFLDENKANFATGVEFQFKLSYFNTSSNKAIFHILQKVKKLSDATFTPKVVWFYNDDDDFMLESGEDFAELLEMPIDFRLA